MNDCDRITLVRSVARLGVAQSRTAAIREVASCLGLESVLVFTTDPELKAMLIAPGFPQTLPHSQSWRGFLAECGERGHHTAELPFTKLGERRSVTGLSWENHSVLALIGPPPAADVIDELRLLLPLLATALSQELALAMQIARARLAGQLTRESAVLAQGLDNARRAAQQEITARKTADTALKLVRDELTRANVELTAARDRAVANATAKDDFLAALSHELRTPLNPVLLLASEGANRPELPAEVRRDFATIAKNAELEARLIDDLLDLTQITRGKMNLDKQALDMRSIIEDAITTVRAEVAAKKIDFVVALDPRAHPVFCDPVRVQQVFWNVLKNAVKFTPPSGRIAVESKLDETRGLIAVTVADTGIGMTASEVERAFESFSQGDHASMPGSHRFGGLGLGLAISRKLIQLHSGTIEATSAGLDKGTTFTVTLPLAAAVTAREPLSPAQSPGTPAENQEARPPTRVLLVEDHEATSMALARLLKRRGFVVVVAASVADACREAEAATFDLVISDIGLPDGDGYALMMTLSQRYSLPGIALTGYGMQEDIARSKAAGFITHVTKPISARALETAIETFRRPEPVAG